MADEIKREVYSQKNLEYITTMLYVTAKEKYGMELDKNYTQTLFKIMETITKQDGFKSSVANLNTLIINEALDTIKKSQAATEIPEKSELNKLVDDLAKQRGYNLKSPDLPVVNFTDTNTQERGIDPNKVLDKIQTEIQPPQLSDGLSLTGMLNPDSKQIVAKLKPQVETHVQMQAQQSPVNRVSTLSTQSRNTSTLSNQISIDFRRDLVDVTGNVYTVNLGTPVDVNSIELKSCIIDRNEILDSEPVIFLQVNGYKFKLCVDKTLPNFIHYRGEGKLIFKAPTSITRLQLSFHKYDNDLINLNKLDVQKIILGRSSRIKCQTTRNHYLSSGDVINMIILDSESLMNGSVITIEGKEIHEIVNNKCFSIDAIKNASKRINFEKRLKINLEFSCK